MSFAVVVPLRDFSLAKVRLRTSGVEDVTELARELATGVLKACGSLSTFVVTESDDVEVFASALGVEVLRANEYSLNGAVRFAYERLASTYDQLVIAHGDLKFPRGLDTFVPESGVTIFTDLRGEGTNILALPTGHDFHFAYGTDSAQRHLAESTRLGLRAVIVRDSPWRFDVDELTDL